MSEGGTSTTATDRALIRAIRAWGGGDLPGYSSRFSEAWRARLESAWPAAAGEKPDAAWSALRRDHEASSRPDPDRVHPSWFVRALRGESLAVRGAVLAHAPRPIREALRRSLGGDLSELATDREPDPEALGWALALWSERLVGDVPRLDSDPPVVAALTRLRRRDLARLVKACGLAKHAFAIDGNGLNGIDESKVRFTSTDRVRLGYFRRQVGLPDPKLVPLARHDLEAVAGDRRRGLARVGLITIGRLLEEVEPHRARWALQHLPYPFAKLTRPKPTSRISRRSLLAWESWILGAAWSRLHSEGWLARWKGSREETAAGAFS